MNSLHVKSLTYRVIHDASVSYDKTAPLEHDTPAFTVRVTDEEARFEMKNEYATVEEARGAVEPFLRAWEMSAALDRGLGEFDLHFVNAEVEDRNPTGHVLLASTSMISVSSLQGSLTVGRGHYPNAPLGIAVDSDIDAMFARYTRYQQGKESLAGSGYFCLTVLEHSAGGRGAAALKFGIARKVLDTLGYLTSEKGGPEARKAAGRSLEFTATERTWLTAVIKKLIRRASEVTYDSSQGRVQITMADLPQLSEIN